MKIILYAMLLGLPGLLLAQIPADRLPYDYRAYQERTEWNIAFFPIDFTDIPEHRRADFPTKEAWQDTIFNGNINKYFSQISYGDFTLTGTVFDYTTSTEIFWDSLTGEIIPDYEILESVNIQAPGIDIDDYDMAYFIVTHDAALGQSVTGEWTWIFNGDTIDDQRATVGYYINGYPRRDSVSWSLENSLINKREYIIFTSLDSAETGFVYYDMSGFVYTTCHELGHSMGIYGHANSSTNGERYDYEEEVPNNGDLMNKEYGNLFSIMGEGMYGASMTGAYRDVTGILDTANIYSANWYGTTTATVFPLNRTDGKRYVEVLLPDSVIPVVGVDVYKNKGYGLELREVDNLDSMLVHPSLSENVNGFFVTKIRGVSNKLLDMSPSANFEFPGEVIPDLRDVVLKPGMTYENDEVKLTNVVNNGDGSFSVDITIKTDKIITPFVDFTSAKRISQDGEIKLDWTNNCESCTSDQLLILEYKHIDSVAWDSLTGTDLLAETFTTSTFSGTPGKFEFRGYIEGNDTHTPSLKSLPIVSEDFVVSVADKFDNSNLQFNVYPNPVTNVLNISTSKAISGVIEISDMKGKLVYSDEVQESNNHKVNLRLKDGIYILHFWQEDAQPIVRKLIVSDQF